MPEDDQEGEEIKDKSLEITGVAITPRPEQKVSCCLKNIYICIYWHFFIEGSSIEISKGWADSEHAAGRIWPLHYRLFKIINILSCDLNRSPLEFVASPPPPYSWISFFSNPLINLEIRLNLLHLTSGSFGRISCNHLSVHLSTRIMPPGETGEVGFLLSICMSVHLSIHQFTISKIPEEKNVSLNSRKLDKYTLQVLRSF